MQSMQSVLSVVFVLALGSAAGSFSDWPQGKYSSFPHLRLSKATQCYSDDDCPRKQQCANGKCEGGGPSTPAPGCCAGDDRKSTMRCSVATEQAHCERLGTACRWIATTDAAECAPPDTTLEPGCCGADSLRNLDRCLAAGSRAHCERMSQCSWFPGEDVDCAWTTTLEPGCCSGATVQAAAHCVIAGDETHCERMTGCDWKATTDPTDCELTTTETPGCCAGSARRFADRCAGAGSKSHCDRMSSCHWVGGEGADCSWTTTTTAAPEPGCCVIADKRPRALEGGWTALCATFEGQELCTRPTSADGLDRCEWVEVERGFDCAELATSTSTTTAEPGCCGGSNARVASRCNKATTGEHCRRMSECFWTTGEDADCEYQRTTPPAIPGCCAGNSYRAFAGCNAVEEEKDCQRMPMCHWMATEDPTDCVMTTSTTTAEPGCCSGSDSVSSAECLKIDRKMLCDRKIRCQWIETDDASDCEATTSTEAAGCCAGEDYGANLRCSKKQRASQCENDPSCHWVAGEEVDCVWTADSKGNALKENKLDTMLFGEKVALRESDELTVSVSTVFVLMLAAIALQYVFKWWRKKKAMAKAPTIRRTEMTGYYQQTS